MPIIKKKRSIFIACLFIIVVLLVVISYISFSNYIYYKNSYNHTIKVLTENIDDFERMCEYDLKHCSEERYQSIYKKGSDISYYVPRVANQFNDQRKMVFNDLGFDNNGFQEGTIYPDQGRIVFDDIGFYHMRLIYTSNESSDNETAGDRIGDHFIISYHEIKAGP